MRCEHHTTRCSPSSLIATDWMLCDVRLYERGKNVAYDEGGKVLDEKGALLALGASVEQDLNLGCCC